MSAGGYYYGALLRQLNSNSTAYSSMQLRVNGDIVFENITGATAGSIATAAQRMIINSSGNVGIGTASPGYKLDVNGTLHSSNITLADGIYHEGDTNTYINFLSDTIQMATAGSVRAYINSAGNVGIGTTSPGGKLTVSANGAEGIEFFPNNFTNGNTIQHYDRTGLAYSSVKTIAGDHRFNIGTSEAMRITSASNVGIGTTSPLSKLHVSGGDIELDDGYEVRFNVTGTVTAEEELVLDAGNTDSKIILEGADSAMKFITGNSTAIAINDSQNVGIGTTSPANKLDVVGISRFTHSSSTAYRGAIETVTDNAYPTWDIGWLHARTTSSTYGNIARFNNQSGTQIGGIFYSGSSGTSFVTTSDYRLKENIKEISDSISRVKKLKPCRFNFAAEKNKVIDGFIAHEVQEVVPEAVHGEKDALQKDGSIDAQTLEVSRLIPVLTKALQEAINKIEELELRIQTIENN